MAVVEKTVIQIADPKFDAAYRCRSLTNASTARDLIMSDKVKGKLAKICNSEKFAHQAMQIALTLVTKGSNSGLLMKCTPDSVISCLVRAMELGFTFDPLLGHCYPVPFGNTCTLMPGYKGLIHLAIQSGYVNLVEARNVYKDGTKNDDVFDCTQGMETSLIHKPNMECDRSDEFLVASYAIAHLKTGEKTFWVSPRSEIDASRDRSKAKNRGPWVNDFNQMARRVPIRRLLNDIPKDPNLAQAVSMDEQGEAGVPQPIHESVIDLAPDKYEAVDPMAIDLEGFVDDRKDPNLAEPELEPGDDLPGMRESVATAESTKIVRPVKPESMDVKAKRNYIAHLKEWKIQEGELTLEQWTEWLSQMDDEVGDISKFDMRKCNNILLLMDEA